jgi:hypothetical protein
MFPTMFCFTISIEINKRVDAKEKMLADKNDSWLFRRKFSNGFIHSSDKQSIFSCVEGRGYVHQISLLDRSPLNRGKYAANGD